MPDDTPVFDEPHPLAAAISLSAAERENDNRVRPVRVVSAVAAMKSGHDVVVDT
jgi:hypothetical protein